MSAIKRSVPREIKIETNINPYATGSAMVSFGNTKIHVTVMVEESIPPFLKGSGQGWITAEYAMLPASTHTRIGRERSKVSGRTQEIQRLIGRSIRAIVDLKLLGERSLLIDCDVIVADGGTRTASITGAYVAVELAVKKLLDKKLILRNPIKDQLAALSVGISESGEIIADLNYHEDSSCETDMNIVMTGSGKFVEIQGTAEGEPFSREQLDALVECARIAMAPVFKAQLNAISQG